MRNPLYSCLVTILTALGLFAAPASALTIIPGSSGLDMAVGCTDPSCFNFGGTPVVVLNLSASAPVSGTFGLTGLTLDFSIDLDSPANLAGPDGAVTSVDFDPMNFLGSVSVVDQGSGNYSIATQIATVSGTLTANGPGTSTVFNALAVNVSGSCLASGDALTCGLTFGGAGNAYQLDVNGTPRYFSQTVDITGVVPEPTTALLFGLGLTGLAARRRSTGTS